MAYPSVGGQRFSVTYAYTSAGYLHYVTDASNGSVLWAGTAMSARGQVTGQQLGNGVETESVRNPATGALMEVASVSHAQGDALIQSWSYTYDEAGNLRMRHRTDTITPAQSEETFDYDRLDRLKSSIFRVPTRAYETSEAYDYNALGNLTKKGTANYQYCGTVASGLNRLCSIEGVSSTFQYDANGSMVSGSGRTIEYDAFNRPSRITSSQDGEHGVNFVYGGDGGRVVQELWDGDARERTLYVGLGDTGRSFYERTTTNGAVEHLYFLYAGSNHGGNAFAVRVVAERGAAPREATTLYHHFDHLGSITAVSDAEGRIIDAVGPGADLISYDAWGARRAVDGDLIAAASFEPVVGRRQFTGHEGIRSVGLSNMNARLYDPVLGRFLSADPTLQFPTDLQNHARYSYVVNNPLRFTDPTGYSILGKVLHYGVNGALAFQQLTCVASGGAACFTYALATAIYNTTAATLGGVSFQQSVRANALGLAAGQFLIAGPIIWPAPQALDIAGTVLPAIMGEDPAETLYRSEQVAYATWATTKAFARSEAGRFVIRIAIEIGVSTIVSTFIPPPLGTMIGGAIGAAIAENIDRLLQGRSITRGSILDKGVLKEAGWGALVGFIGGSAMAQAQVRGDIDLGAYLLVKGTFVLMRYVLENFETCGYGEDCCRSYASCSSWQPAPRRN
jgi:RHS repeat-associated protein